MIKERIQSMKLKTTLRLMTVLMLGASITHTTVEAGFFDKIKAMGKKAQKAVQKVAHASIGKMAMKAGGAAVAAKMGPDAGSMFQGAAQSMHLADEADAAADDADQAAQQATEDGDDAAAAAHKTTAAIAMHRATAKAHRADHDVKKKAYEDAGGNFDADYAKHVASKIEDAVENQGDDADGDDDAGGDDSSDDSNDQPDSDSSGDSDDSDDE